MNIIFFIHLVLFGAVLVTPFLKNTQLLEMYSIVVPFIFYHWSVNDDTCALTQMEMFVTGNSKEETFFGRIMGPIYKMDDTDANKFLKTILQTILLVMFTARLVIEIDEIAWGSLRSLSRSIRAHAPPGTSKSDINDIIDVDSIKKTGLHFEI